MNNITPLRPASPFDAIRQVREDGTEYWSARDLMPLLGYPEWREFRPAIERAWKSAEAQGFHAPDLFGVITEKGLGRPREDVHLTRFAAYLVAMNGDPRKSEVSEAQGYFAVKTREAEVAPQQLDEIEVAERYLAALKEKKALAAKIEADRPLVAQAETFRQADGLRTVGDLANDLKLHAASNYPGVKIKRDDVFDLAGRIGLLIRGNTVRHNQPTARAIEARWVRPKETVYEDSQGRPHAKVGTRLTPKGYGRLWDAAVKNLQEHGTVLPNLKEIAG